MIKAIVMAGGKGTRLNSQIPKVLHSLFDKPLLQHVLDTLAQALGSELDEVFVITGHGAEEVQDFLNQNRYPFRLTTVLQVPQLGTGHAIQQVLPYLPSSITCQVMILSGDVPLLETGTLQALSRKTDDLTVVCANVTDPGGYGRVISLSDSRIAIIEDKDCTPAQKTCHTVNAGIYQCAWSVVAPLLTQLTNQNAQQEFYLTDLVALATQHGRSVDTLFLSAPQEMIGVNTRADLATCHRILQARINQYWMQAGVTIIDPNTTWIGPNVVFEPDVTLYPGCWITGTVSIASGCILAPSTIVKGPATIGPQTTIGPFAHLRQGVTIAGDVRIGNFVEVKNTQIGQHTNAAHLSYLGDAVLGDNINIGAGTITANYDPVRQRKSQTRLADGVKIGSNSVLIAPVTVNANASVAAGSVITEDVNAGSLAIARGRQIEIPGWVEKTILKSDTD